ncbi:hypothetical protein BGW39_004963 [Mortierella sp. 14UC]|nr:hypothetical protein BGW39_004963 [Mortierella sp. 14UC]
MSIAILYKGDIVFAEGLGKRNEHQPFTKEAFTATAIGELVAEGKIDWDTTPVNTYLPEFQLKDPVQTLSIELGTAWYRTKEPRRELIRRLRYAEMPSKLTSIVNYSNIMYSVAGEAAANVAGVSYEQVVHDKIFAPLRLSNTGFSQSAMKKLSNHASPYYSDSLEDAQRGVFQQQEYDEIYMAVSPAGDIYSNVLDLLRWGKCVMDGGRVDGGQVLDEKNIERTLTPHSIDGLERRTAEFAIATMYGLGWSLDTYKGHNHYRHSGSYPGSKASLAIFPDDDLVIAQLANIQLTGLLDNINFFIADMLLDLPLTQDWLFDVAVRKTSKMYQLTDAQSEKGIPPQIKNRPSLLPREELVGEFEDALYGRLIVTTTVVLCQKEERDGDEEEKEENKLEFRYNNYKSILEHYHFDAFKAVFSDLGETFAVTVCYQVGGDGHVSGLVVGFEEPVCSPKVKEIA